MGKIFFKVVYGHWERIRFGIGVSVRHFAVNLHRNVRNSLLSVEDIFARRIARVVEVDMDQLFTTQTNPIHPPIDGLNQTELTRLCIKVI